MSKFFMHMFLTGNILAHADSQDAEARTLDQVETGGCLEPRTKHTLIMNAFIDAFKRITRPGYVRICA